MTKLYSGKDVDKKALKKARIAILGYGSQGRAHALNLKDSGHDVVVGVRKNGASWKKAKKDGLKVAEPVDAVKGASLVAMLVPDLAQAELYKQVAGRELAREGNHPALRARPQRALQADQAAQGSRRLADCPQGSR
jgi:ketol-acid reductoisomerase